MDQAAILADAVSTPFAAVVRTAEVHLGNAVGVWGLGSVGTHILQLAEQAMKFLDVGGKLVTVGMSAQELKIGSFMEVALRRKKVLGHLGYKVQDIAMLAELVSYGRLDLSESITAVVPLAEIHRGIEMLQHRQGNPIRILVKP